MIRDKYLSSENYKPSFSGHETFPFRYGWLKKGFDEVAARKDDAAFQMFKDTDAIATFGVGKNMVTAIRYWLNAVDLICDDSKTITTSDFGDWLLSNEGQDPYLESKDTLFLIHWKLCGARSALSQNDKTTTWYLVFNHFSGLVFDRSELVEFIEEFIAAQGWNSVAHATLFRDIDCLLRMYVPSATGTPNEENLDSPMSELGLIHRMAERKKYCFNNGPKPTLSKRVFLFSLMDFWAHSGMESSLAIDKILHDPGSPGRVFKIDKNTLAELIDNITHDTKGALDWTQTSGLSQLTLNKKIGPKQAYALMNNNEENI